MKEMGKTRENMLNEIACGPSQYFATKVINSCMPKIERTIRGKRFVRNNFIYLDQETFVVIEQRGIPCLKREYIFLIPVSTSQSPNWWIFELTSIESAAISQLPPLDLAHPIQIAHPFSRLACRVLIE